jgi:ABC-type uncharacterized transport system involved in gliding motility auxiliary subunit
MATITHTDNDKRLHVVFDDERTAPPENYTIWLVSMSRGVAAQPWESPAATWQRVLDTVAGMRNALDAPQLYFATVFADVSATEQQRQAITKDRVSERLYQLADARRNKDADTRVKALSALAELYGLNQPQTVYITLPTLEELDAEIARRKAL